MMTHARQQAGTIQKTLEFCLLMVFAYLTVAKDMTLAANERQLPQRPEHSIIVPDQFLRRWDPVTLFFNKNTGSAANTAEDHPQRYVSMSPDHPGAYTWLDRRTLQFRPAEPWPPLTRFNWRIGKETVSLTTLMDAPLLTVPGNNSEGLAPVEAIRMMFSEPLDPVALSRMITIELRPLPGIDTHTARWLNHKDFDIKILERKDRSDNAGYVVILHNPIPMGTRAIVHMRLSVTDTVDETFYRISFKTAKPFTVTEFGCSGRRYPTTEKGVSYTREQALECSSAHRVVEVLFSGRPRDLGPIEARNLVRFTPGVADLDFSVAERKLTIAGKFETGILYDVSLNPCHVLDENGRKLSMKGASRLYAYFPDQPQFLQWTTSQGIVEQFGPQMVPLKGRGFERLDVRIHRIDPLNRSYWPFPDRPVVVDEDKRPPGPGEEPAPFRSPHRYISANELARQIKALGSPSVSKIVDIPLRKNGGTASFGLDLAPFFRHISGAKMPGTYLVGIRNLDHSENRSWIRVQVTDLSLTTVEESRRVTFAVTSLSTGKPVPGATISVEGFLYESGGYTWETVITGNTDRDGTFYWKDFDRTGYNIRRIVVSNDRDILVLDSSRAPDQYADNNWAGSENNWLQWTQADLSGRAEPEKTLCHMFTERPVYRPEDPVHIKGYLRRRADGKFSAITGSGFVVVDGPGDLEWRYPISLKSQGSFYHLFREDKLPTGEYMAWYETKKGHRFGSVRFKKEAYRLPKFEVLLSGPDITGLDDRFTIKLTAEYYAGGRVNNRPVRFRVTQFPYTWAPEKRDGFVYSTDARFSGDGRFRSTPLREVDESTDEHGGAAITIDPTIEPTSQPRRYIVEATVTGADDQSVSTTHHIRALPPFVLGLKAPRYLEDVRSIDPEIIAVGPDGTLLAGQKITVRLLQRQWHSYLQAGDFSQSAAKYVTDVVDRTIYEKHVESEAKPLIVKLPVETSGVYIIEIESQDKLGRTQVVSRDLFAGGKEQVTWPQPPSKVFKVTPEKAEYIPGETATLIIESPFQNARALTVIERPDGKNNYQWITIRNGTAAFELVIEKNFMPRIPVHFILMRGRIPAKSHQTDRSKPDMTKPFTMAATAWVGVSRAKHQVSVDLDYPAKAQPGDTVDITITLRDDNNAPLAGEVTLWLVDQAVLALGTEQRLDPLPDIISPCASHIFFHDTRNLTLGYLPLLEHPGGDGSREAEKSDLLEKVTIRKTFNPVPYYNPRVIVEKSGKATIPVRLPDNLSNFKIRAKVVSGDRFGFAKGHMAIRLPVIVQSSLPRFVRPGDAFTAIGIGRIVEGGGGAGQSEISVTGLTLVDPAVQAFTWIENTPLRIEYSVRVPTPEYSTDGMLKREHVTVVMGVERITDHARDAFQKEIPIRYDRKSQVIRDIKNVAHGKPVTFAAVSEPFRPGTFKRTLFVTAHPALARLSAGLDYLINYPHGCTEQRISLARAKVAAKRFRDLLYLDDSEEELTRAVNQTMEWIAQVVDGHGLVAYWPGSTGSVSLTAWCVQYMVEAEQAGFRLNGDVYANLIGALKKALRSDYGYYIEGADYAERCWALTALADAGEIDRNYAAELARKSDYLDLESQAQVMRALLRSGETDTPIMNALVKRLFGGIVFKFYQGKEIYGGLQETATSRIALILPSQSRTLAQVLRALYLIPAAEKARRGLLLESLIAIGKSDGWGSTNANCEVVLALSEILSGSNAEEQTHIQRNVSVAVGKVHAEMILDGDYTGKQTVYTSNAPIELELKKAPNSDPLLARLVTNYIPQADGSQVAAGSQGFVVNREELGLSDGNAPPRRTQLDSLGKTIALSVGDIIEEHIELVNPEDRHYVALVIPLAAGMEPLNPNLATAPPEAEPSKPLTLPPTYVAFMDDQMAYYYNTLPKGTYHFYFRTRAAVPGRYIQPAAYAEMMYDLAVRGNGNGAIVHINKN